MKKIFVLVVLSILLGVSPLQAEVYGGDCSDFESLLSIGASGVTNVGLYVFDFYDRQVTEIAKRTSFEVVWGPRCMFGRYVMWSVKTSAPEFINGWIAEGEGYFGSRYVSVFTVGEG